ncbi:MAG: amidase [Gemmatimonadetes bacterium]|nr:amidase [Gemmatimonadota bacterium]MBI3568590.1 amidase [Gemmatimonadota bacterium]
MPDADRSSLDRRGFVGASLAAGAAALMPRTARASAFAAASATAPAAERPAEDELFERSIAELGAMMQRGTLTSRALTQRYLVRIARMDKNGPAVNAVIELNPDALAIADARDAERKAGTVRGPLHGIPVLVKDNIDSADAMRTTAGSLALATSTPPKDAFIVERLREAGAVLLGKTNLSEWANYRSTRSSSGWSGRGGQTRNPYVLDRNPCGSSSGTGAAIASDFATVGIGTETDGSIICPSSINGLVGVKPTVGLWSRGGIIPISASQDTAGPMARTVADAAALLGALTGVDPRDAATTASRGKAATDYTSKLDAGALKGARIGVARNLAGFNPDVDATFDRAIAALRDAGAVIVDPVKLATAGKYGDAEGVVLDYEFKAGLNAYLASLGANAPVKSLAELIAFNEREKAREMPWFGQETFIRAEKCGPLTDKKYREARAKCVRLARTQGLDAAMQKHRLTALVAPSNAPAWPTDHLNGDHVTGGDTSFAAVAGYPCVTVPMGLVHELPVGLSFIGAAWSEAALLGYAFAFEQATKARRSPKFLPTLA